MAKKKLAIIGTGISGLGVAYFLRDQYDITLYEKNDYIGGHTNTITIVDQKQELAIDTAFMVFNEHTYPLLTRLFKELGVKTRPTSMSFSVAHVPTGLEYCGSGFQGLFAQRRNMFNRSFLRMLLDIERFNKEAMEVLINPVYENITLAEYVAKKGYTQDFLHKFLIPMSSAVWSTPPDAMLNFPAVTLVRFFKNHCFLGMSGHLEWRTCLGGSRNYRDKLLAQTKAVVCRNRGVLHVKDLGSKVSVTDTMGGSTDYDHVVIAAHADDALAMLKNPTPLQQLTLSQFPYINNSTILHTDDRVMPRYKRAWASWNYRIVADANGVPQATTIYYINALQGIASDKDWFISINDPGLIDPAKIVWRMDYRHPRYTPQSQQAQPMLQQLNEGKGISFCGAYFRYGFHEDGLWSAHQVAQTLSKDPIWP